jgi:hypothetical protein
MAPEATAAFVRAEADKWSDVVNAEGLKLK